ncbi:hypothetical protein INT47_011512 [Mucor saturninus]|uniref:Reverse transcriptase domain-containing protein n=1 Tax=Mucor saturninus TaxID=64648 RepID=A0A8H7USW2_9FUNG|nr:hypothetical protein INT47_011512 [Mucor saturninus]
MPSLQGNIPQLPPMSSMQTPMPHNMYIPTYQEARNHTLPPIRQGQASSFTPMVRPEPMMLDGNVSSGATMGDKPRRVTAPVLDIGQKLGASFLGGRKPRKDKSPVRLSSVVNLVQDVLSDSESEGDSESESVISTSGYESYSDTSSEEESDNDSIYDYPYKKVLLESSSPLAVLGMVRDYPVKLVLDSGSAISVVISSFAERLGLVGSGDVLNIKTIKTTKVNRKRNQCEITTTGPVRIGGRLRLEHIVIKEDNYSNSSEEPLVLLGMAFLRQYGITLHAKENLVEIPVKNGPASIMVQAHSTKGSISKAKAAGTTFYAVSLLPDGFKPDCYEYLVENLEDVQPKYHQGIAAMEDDTSYGEKGRSATTSNVDDLKLYLDEAIPEQKEFKYSLNPDTGVTTLQELPSPIGEVVKVNKFCFAELGGPGLVKDVELKIELKPGAVPVKSRVYEMSWEEDEYLKEEFDSMLKLGLIRPSKSVWVSGIFFIRRATGGLRLIYDLRGINKNIVIEDFPMPNVFDVVTSFHGKKYFTVLDLANGFRQVALHEDPKQYTGFICKYGMFEHNRIPFGLSLSPGFFNRSLMNILGPYIGKYFYLLVDDVIIGTDTVELHAFTLNLLLELLAKANLKLKWAKAEIFKTEITYLGHRISAEGNVSELKSFLGTMNFYPKFIPLFAATACPLTNLLKKKVKYVWRDACQEAFDVFKTRLTSAPLWAHLSPYQLQRLTTDCAPSQGLGRILSQSPDGTEEN